MLIVRKVEVCPNCRIPTIWRLMDDYLVCERCQRKRRVQSSRSPAIVLCLLAFLLAWLTFAFGAEAPAPDPNTALPATVDCDPPSPPPAPSLPPPPPRPERGPSVGVV